MTKAKDNTELARIDSDNELAPLDLFEAQAGAGLENIGREQMSMPILKLLQSNSPELERGNAKYMSDARAGDFVNNLTNELYNGQTGLQIIQFHFSSKVIEWVPREQGGGYVAEHNNKADALRNQREGTQLVDTFNHFLFISETGRTWTPILFPSKSTNLKYSRKFNTIMSNAVIVKPDGRTFTPPTYAKYYLLRSKPEKNQKGSFFVAEFSVPEAALADPNANIVRSRELIASIEAFREASLRGDVLVDETGGAAAEPTVEDEDIKF